MSEKQDHWERYWSGRVCEQPEGPSQDADAFAGSHPRWNRLTRCFDHSAPFKVVWMDADARSRPVGTPSSLVSACCPMGPR